MPRAGHVQIDGRDYKLVSETDYRRYAPNPLQASGNTGGAYGDLVGTDIDQFTDYSAGLGKRESTGGGFYYATAETRFPNMVTLGPYMEYCGIGSDASPGTGVNPGGYDNAVEVSEGDKVAAKIVTVVAGDLYYVYIFADIPEGNEVGVSIQADSEGEPSGTIYGSEVTILGDGNGPHWYLAAVDDSYGLPDDYYLPEGTRYIPHFRFSWGDAFETISTGLSLSFIADTSLWIVARAVSGAFSVYSDGETLGSSSSGVYTEGSWTVDTTKRMAAFSDLNVTVDGIDYFANDYRLGNRIVLFGDYIVWSTLTKLLYLDVDSINATPSVVDLDGAHVTDVIVWGDHIVVATGAGIKCIDDSMTIVSDDLSSSADRLFKWGYYLYYSKFNVLYYTADDAPSFTWHQIGYADETNGPYTIGPYGYNITGMAGLNDTDLLVATTEALYMVSAGDVVTGVRRWATSTEAYGLNMINHQGEVFIPAGETILQTDDTLSILPMGPDRDEGLPILMAGNVTGMCSTNNWMFCVVTNDSADQNQGSALYAYNDQGWHYVSSMPKWIRLESLVYNPADQHLYGTDGRHAVRWFLPDKATVPPRIVGAKYSPYGYLDSVPLFGSLRKFDKDYNSVYVEGDNLDADSYITIKWRTSESAAWSTLGSVTADQTTLYWSDMSTRPLSKKLYLRAELYTNDIDTTPVLRALALEYQQMVRDRWQWNMPLIISGDKWDLQVMADGSRNVYDTDTMMAHLVALRDSKQPFRLVDIDDQVYYAKVLSVSFAPYVASEYSEETGERDVEWVASVVLDQVLVSG